MILAIAGGIAGLFGWKGIAGFSIGAAAMCWNMVQD